MAGKYKRTLETKRKTSRSVRNFYKMNPLTPEERLARGNRGADHPNWLGPRVIIFCKQCGKKMVVQPNSTRLFCRRSCISRWVASHPSDKTRRLLSEAASRRNHNPNDAFGNNKGKHFSEDGVPFHSYYEYRFYKAAKKIGMRVERNTTRFLYIWKGKKHYYTPDFKIYTPFVIFIEIKGWPRPRDYRKVSAVQKAGHQILMWTDKGIKILEKEAEDNSCLSPRK